MKKLAKRILEKFIRIDVVPYYYRGYNTEYRMMFLFGYLFSTIQIVDNKIEDEQSEYLGILR
ncbi:hypothetical protein OZ664_20060 [Elizabethkingia sp. HX WHF]|uniref:hypothetical protein n=1 Tax=Elizabethkingia sp. HX WHF TaxID=3003190 RepID=UPI002A24AEC9|nr:hypothetical protein [Elizabethkingia sp. HX WHF]MDX8566313.1 hypothetical protein [Elizabethkingia sp. HX WHF]